MGSFLKKDQLSMFWSHLFNASIHMKNLYKKIHEVNPASNPDYNYTNSIKEITQRITFWEKNSNIKNKFPINMFQTFLLLKKNHVQVVLIEMLFTYLLF